MSEPKCNLCETGFPLNEHGEHLPSQRLGMIPVTRCKKLPPAPSAAEKQRGSGKPAWWKLGVPEPSRHSGQAVDEEGFEAHVAKMDKEHPAWLKGNNHGATSLIAVAREFWDAARRGQAVDRQPVSVKKLHANVVKYLEHEAQAVDRQEWTAEWLANFGKPDDWLESICNAHNAALAAERQRAEQVEQLYDAAENERQIVKSQLLSALAAIEKHNTDHVDDSFCCIDADLSLLHQHDAELTEKVRKPLVELLRDAGCRLRELTRCYEQQWGKDHTRDFHELIKRIDAPLAQCKQP